MALHYCFDGKTSAKRKGERIKKAFDIYIEKSKLEADQKDVFYKQLGNFTNI